MTPLPRVRARIIGALLVALFVWPAAHRVLTATADVNPWKLYGAAMYCTPHDLAIALVDETGELREIRDDELGPRSREALDRFLSSRITLGRLASPDALGAALLAELPRTRRLSVRVGAYRLRGGVLDLQPRTYVYER